LAALAIFSRQAAPAFITRTLGVRATAVMAMLPPALAWPPAAVSKPFCSRPSWPSRFYAQPITNGRAGLR